MMNAYMTANGSCRLQAHTGNTIDNDEWLFKRITEGR